ncbi:YheC/YheD family protein [Cohnella fermenti]|uniref:YheC/YheD family protein n=1 Tax=Cohnella fermenti TaxID=2565925 RepID=A0A4S4BGU9_9BACL|nr:YheC/YheD family protein [Cohnella fermenti]THF73693.1 YheC/YheD family protein [Cohnella fermenti]
MPAYRSVSFKSKWVKTKWLLADEALEEYVPWTLPFTAANLAKILSRHSTVYFKPTGGTGGRRIIRIARQGEQYTTKLRHTTRKHAGAEALQAYLSKKAASEPYLLQQEIPLVTVKGKPFDIRVMVQKTSEGAWTSTALFMKIGKSGSVATNYNQGGKIGFFEPTLEDAGFRDDEIRRIRTELEELGESVGALFDRHKSGFRELGLDVALDNRGLLWILEVNTRPQFYPLKKMSDRTLYRKIVSYAEQYGRKK